MAASPVIKLNSGYDMPQVGFGLWKVDNPIAADVVYNAIKAGYRLFDGACGKLRWSILCCLYDIAVRTARREGQGSGMRESCKLPRPSMLPHVHTAWRGQNPCQATVGRLRAHDATVNAKDMGRHVHGSSLRYCTQGSG